MSWRDLKELLFGSGAMPIGCLTAPFVVTMWIAVAVWDWMRSWFK